MTQAAFVPVRRDRFLWIEFTALFILAPVVVAILLPARAMFPALLSITAVGLVLLHFTPGFRWRELARGRIRWAEVLLVAVICAAFSWIVLRFTSPGALFVLPRHQPDLWLTIMVLYPLLSALPQEVVFRALYFRRYGELMPTGTAILVNGAVFSLAHLMYWSWIVAAMTFVGGILFARAHVRQGSFPQAVVLHAVTGCILFTLGMGMFFYSGNVSRPF